MFRKLMTKTNFINPFKQTWPKVFMHGICSIYYFSCDTFFFLG